MVIRRSGDQVVGIRISGYQALEFLRFDFACCPGSLISCNLISWYPDSLERPVSDFEFKLGEGARRSKLELESEGLGYSGGPSIPFTWVISGEPKKFERALGSRR